MDSLGISVRKQIKYFEKNLGDFAKDQMPFAAAGAINTVARKIIEGEKEQIRKTFGPVTPFTLSGFRLKTAKKTDLVATITLMPIQAGYLDPYEGGGKQVPHITAMLTPKNIALNQYGNIPFGALKYLKAQKGLAAAVKSKNKSAIAMAQAKLNTLGKGDGGYFVGKVKGIGGLWQRINTVEESGVQRRATKRDIRDLDKSHIERHLKLIIRFTDPVAVKLQLHYADRANEIVNSSFGAAFGDAMKNALATRR